MQQYECGHCGHDMTGVERFSSSVDMIMIPHMDGTMPIATQGLYNASATNSVKCPRCGRSGYWFNHI